MQRFNVRFKDRPGSAEVQNIEAATAADALREAARMLGMDTDPLTQTYTLTLEAIPATDPHAKARRELAACERDRARGIHREIKGPELARRRAMIEADKAAARARLEPDTEPTKPASTRPLYLIACSGSKLETHAKARDLYTGQAFRFAMAAADRAGADVLILSALHGLVDPDAWLSPYNVTLSDMTATDRAAWATRTAAELEPHRGRDIVVLAGQHYAAALEGFPNVTRPLAGLGIGQQLAALKTMNAPRHEPPRTIGQLALELN